MKCLRCGTNKRFTVSEWNKCPWQLADWKAETYWCLLPRFITRWWYFRNNPKHLLVDKDNPRVELIIRMIEELK